MWVTRQYKRIGQGLLLALFLLAVTLAGGTHRINLPPQDPELAAYLAAGGSIHELCLGLDEDQSDIAGGCPLCVLASAAILPPILDRILAADTAGDRLKRPLLHRVIPAADIRARPPVRAPPQT